MCRAERKLFSLGFKDGGACDGPAVPACTAPEAETLFTIGFGVIIVIKFVTIIFEGIFLIAVYL